MLDGVLGIDRGQRRPESTIEITMDDAIRCNRLRGKSVRDCASCRVGDRWLDCPPAAHLALLDPSVIRDATLLADRAAAFTVPVPVASAGDTRSAAKSAGFTGNVCSVCYSAKMIRAGACETCLDCGSSNGCS